MFGQKVSKLAYNPAPSLWSPSTERSSDLTPTFTRYSTIYTTGLRDYGDDMRRAPRVDPPGTRPVRPLVGAANGFRGRMLPGRARLAGSPRSAIDIVRASVSSPFYTPHVAVR